ncbi:hypothetical protein SKAU_G00085720 [Synaphobranchus kaupii]|uniref:Uncharacterized protein n=1 Tax=Synaphobranchus kaupii TaxID=118154 RepID=A0A9Q1FVD9_SYNKA|nr:hypothetical protein SKAU_G00085720 [Synaphobranchus kaupii]
MPFVLWSPFTRDPGSPSLMRFQSHVCICGARTRGRGQASPAAAEHSRSERFRRPPPSLKKALDAVQNFSSSGADILWLPALVSWLELCRNVGAIRTRSGSCYRCGTHIFSAAAGPAFSRRSPDPPVAAQTGAAHRGGTRDVAALADSTPSEGLVPDQRTKCYENSGRSRRNHNQHF